MTKPEDSPYIVWVDLELTGNKYSDQILEIGAVMTDRDLNELSFRNLVVRYDPSYGMDPFVKEMHTKNGLLDDAWESRLMIDDADVEMASWIKQYTSGDHIPLAGSGVSHFDRKYIDSQLPRFSHYLAYWMYDTGVIRRTLKLFGIDVSVADTSEDKTHRALDDIRAHVEEMRRYKTMFKRWDDGGLLLAVRSGWPG